MWPGPDLICFLLTYNVLLSSTDEGDPCMFKQTDYQTPASNILVPLHKEQIKISWILPRTIVHPTTKVQQAMTAASGFLYPGEAFVDYFTANWINTATDGHICPFRQTCTYPVLWCEYYSHVWESQPLTCLYCIMFALQRNSIHWGYLSSFWNTPDIFELQPSQQHGLDRSLQGVHDKNHQGYDNANNMEDH